MSRNNGPPSKGLPLWAIAPALVIAIILATIVAGLLGVTPSDLVEVLTASAGLIATIGALYAYRRASSRSSQQPEPPESQEVV